jgi:hypothetical protein
VKNIYTEDAESTEGTEKERNKEKETKKKERKEAPKLRECGAGENVISDTKTKCDGRDHGRG